MPLLYSVLFGSCRPVAPDGPAVVLRPPVFLPYVKPATICQFCERRFDAVMSTPLKLVLRYGLLSRTLLCRPLYAGSRLYTVAVVAPCGPFGTVTVNGT